MEYSIYYYDKCSTCQKTKVLLENHGVEAKYHSYFDDRLSTSAIESLLSKLGMKASEFIRRKDLFNELKLDGVNESRLIQAMSDNPGLIQRPVLVKGDKAVVCRPPEKALELINV